MHHTKISVYPSLVWVALFFYLDRCVHKAFTKLSTNEDEENILFCEARGMTKNMGV